MKLYSLVNLALFCPLMSHGCDWRAATLSASAPPASAASIFIKDRSAACECMCACVCACVLTSVSINLSSPAGQPCYTIVLRCTTAMISVCTHTRQQTHLQQACTEKIQKGFYKYVKYRHGESVHFQTIYRQSCCNCCNCSATVGSSLQLPLRCLVSVPGELRTIVALSLFLRTFAQMHTHSHMFTQKGPSGATCDVDLVWICDTK